MATCLIVEDSEVIRTILRRVLEEMGHVVSEASGPAGALDFCRDHAPDVIFLDWDLPGLGALDILRSLGGVSSAPRPKIILCATENDPKQIALAKAAGAQHHILKPFDHNSVLAILRKAGIVGQIDKVSDTVSYDASGSAAG